MYVNIIFNGIWIIKDGVCDIRSRNWKKVFKNLGMFSIRKKKDNWNVKYSVCFYFI